MMQIEGKEEICEQNPPRDFVYLIRGLSKAEEDALKLRAEDENNLVRLKKVVRAMAEGVHAGFGLKEDEDDWNDLLALASKLSGKAERSAVELLTQYLWDTHPATFIHGAAFHLRELLREAIANSAEPKERDKVRITHLEWWTRADAESGGRESLIDGNNGDSASESILAAQAESGMQAPFLNVSWEPLPDLVSNGPCFELTVRASDGNVYWKVRLETQVPSLIKVSEPRKQTICAVLQAFLADLVRRNELARSNSDEKSSRVELLSMPLAKFVKHAVESAKSQYKLETGTEVAAIEIMLYHSRYSGKNKDEASSPGFLFYPCWTTQLVDAYGEQNVSRDGDLPNDFQDSIANPTVGQLLTHTRRWHDQLGPETSPASKIPEDLAPVFDMLKHLGDPTAAEISRRISAALGKLGVYPEPQEPAGEAEGSGNSEASKEWEELLQILKQVDIGAFGKRISDALLETKLWPEPQRPVIEPSNFQAIISHLLTFPSNYLTDTLLPAAAKEGEPLCYQPKGIGVAGEVADTLITQLIPAVGIEPSLHYEKRKESFPYLLMGLFEKPFGQTFDASCIATPLLAKGQLMGALVAYKRSVESEGKRSPGFELQDAVRIESIAGKVARDIRDKKEFDFITNLFGAWRPLESHEEREELYRKYIDLLCDRLGFVLNLRSLRLFERHGENGQPPTLDIKCKYPRHVHFVEWTEPGMPEQDLFRDGTVVLYVPSHDETESTAPSYLIQLKLDEPERVFLDHRDEIESFLTACIALTGAVSTKPLGRRSNPVEEYASYHNFVDWWADDNPGETLWFLARDKATLKAIIARVRSRDPDLHDAIVSGQIYANPRITTSYAERLYAFCRDSDSID